MLRKVWGEAENMTKSKNKNRQKSEKELKHKFAQADKPAVRGSTQGKPPAIGEATSVISEPSRRVRQGKSTG